MLAIEPDAALRDGAFREDQTLDCVRRFTTSAANGPESSVSKRKRNSAEFVSGGIFIIWKDELRRAGVKTNIAKLVGLSFGFEGGGVGATVGRPGVTLGSTTGADSPAVGEPAGESVSSEFSAFNGICETGFTGTFCTTSCDCSRKTSHANVPIIINDKAAAPNCNMKNLCRNKSKIDVLVGLSNATGLNSFL